ncbi:hypothetical protein [Streptomyces sp. NPDC017988]|uniref:hypothetical protein n=1 Tax=Streptomyces sp. NPDC017988 TaxID=3365025 RepID=UPI0037880DAF
MHGVARQAGIVRQALGAGPLGALARGGSVAGKAGLGAKAAGIGAKIGTYADPLSAGLTVGGKAVSKLPTVAEVTSRIRGCISQQWFGPWLRRCSRFRW